MNKEKDFVKYIEDLTFELTCFEKKDPLGIQLKEDD
jgi:hypothetical protein